MGWQDRQYTRSTSYPGGGNPLLWLLTGSVSLGTWFGIRVRVHASLIILVALTLMLDYSHGYHLANRVTSMGVLFGLVLLHEFGHCAAARMVGGEAREILMWPLGGLAMADAPRRPLPQFITVIGGPMVNVAVCALAAASLYAITGRPASLDPFRVLPPVEYYFTTAAFYIWWVFKVSYLLLLFNLLPIFPLDGGQMLQTALWPVMGYYRSMNFACVTGMAGAVVLAVWGVMAGAFILLFVAINGLLVCYQQRMYLRQYGPDAVMAFDDYGGYERAHRGGRHLSRRLLRRARRQAAREQAEQARVDAILEKVSAHGMHSLTWWERRTLRKATERQRQRDMDSARSRPW